MRSAIISGFFLLSAVLMLSACGRPNPHNMWLMFSTRIEVFRYLEDGTTELIFETEKRVELEKFRFLFGFEDTPAYKCGYDGLIKAWKGEEVLEMEYTLQKDCQHYRYEHNGEVLYKKLTEEGVIFLFMISE